MYEEILIVQAEISINFHSLTKEGA